MPETKKKRHNKVDKRAMWDSFISTNDNVECVYRSEGERDKCDCCDGNLVVAENGFLTCVRPSCGIIYNDYVDMGAEWRYYGGEDNSGDPTRVGPPINPLLKESSYGCRVICPMRSSYEMRKIRRYSEWQCMPYKEKSQYEEFQRISLLASQAGLPKMIIDDAMRYHKSISDNTTFRGLNRHGIIAASIYVSSRINNYPRTPKEIATIFNLDNASTTKGCKNALSIIQDLEQNMEYKDKTIFCKSTPIQFLDRYCSRLNMNFELTKLCKFIAMRIERKNLIPEKMPLSIAVGIVYFVAHECNQPISKKDIHDVSEISEVTISKCYKKLVEVRDQLMPPMIAEKYAKK
jgi:transcription initiation factor TFIIB